jgi:hypothetical protein
VAFKYFCVDCNVFIVCVMVMQISYKSSVVVKTSQPVIGGDLKEMEQIVAFSSDTGIKPCGDERDRNVCAG